MLVAIIVFELHTFQIQGYYS